MTLLKFRWLLHLAQKKLVKKDIKDIKITVGGKEIKNVIATDDYHLEIILK